MTAYQCVGISHKALKEGVEHITGINPDKEAVYTEETGHVMVVSEMEATLGDCSCDGGGAGGECEAICFLIIAVAMVMVFIAWAIIMLVFSIFTFGGFVKRRHMCRLLIEREHRTFIGRLAVYAARRGGLLYYELGHPSYDEWYNQSRSAFNRLVWIRQLAILFGTIWGTVEIAFKLYQMFIDTAFTYDLWPLRYVMVAVFVPMILYSPVVEYRIRSLLSEADEVLTRLMMEEPDLNPDNPMHFAEKPELVPVPLPPAPEEAEGTGEAAADQDTVSETADRDDSDSDSIF